VQLIADIITDQDELTNESIINAIILGSICHPEKVKELKEIPFIIDSGATTTTLSLFFAKLIGINVDELPVAVKPCIIAGGGKIYPRVLDFPELKFNVEDGNKQKQETFNPRHVLVMPNPKGRKKIKASLNLLGMDVLCSFSNWEWNFNTGKLYLKP
jgi:hypothetical protein